MQDNHITDQRARTFVSALRRFEQDGNEELFGLFTDDATATRLDARGERTDVAEFWREYRAQFDKLSTTFVDVVEGGDQFALEWTTDATMRNGHPVSYRGVTVLDMADERVARLRTYYDTAVFTAVPAGAAKA